MRSQTMVTVRLTSGEVDVLAAIAMASGQRTNSQAARVYRLHREYCKACRAAGIVPDRRLLYTLPDCDEYGVDEHARLCDTLGDILDAVRASIRSDDWNDEENKDDD